MAQCLMGKKRGMTQVFDEAGKLVVCTVIHVEPSVITQIKTKEKDGYKALQLAFDEVKVRDARTIAKRVNKPQRGLFEKTNVAPSRFLYEARLESVDNFEVGQKLDLSLFSDALFVDVRATSKGKGFQGVIKKYNFSGGPASHGSGFHRHAGSTGMRSTPGRSLPGGPRPSHMGDNNVTVENLRVVSVDEENNLLLVEGAIPGAKNSVVTISNAKKKQKAKKK